MKFQLQIWICEPWTHTFLSGKMFYHENTKQCFLSGASLISHKCNYNWIKGSKQKKYDVQFSKNISLCFYSWVALTNFELFLFVKLKHHMHNILCKYHNPQLDVGLDFSSIKGFLQYLGNLFLLSSSSLMFVMPSRLFLSTKHTVVSWWNTAATLLVSFTVQA